MLSFVSEVSFSSLCVGEDAFFEFLVVFGFSFSDSNPDFGGLVRLSLVRDGPWLGCGVKGFEILGSSLLLKSACQRCKGILAGRSWSRAL